MDGWLCTKTMSISFRKWKPEEKCSAFTTIFEPWGYGKDYDQHGI